MAKLEIRVSNEQHEALDDSLKPYYVATEDGKGFELEGIGSIQRALAEEKAKKTTKPELLTELEELKKFKQDHEAAETKAAQDQLVAKGDFEKAQASRDAEWQKRLDAISGEKDTLFADVHRERLTNELVKRGTLPDRADYLVNELVEETELFKRADTGKYDIRKKGGIGDAAEFDLIVEEKKGAKPFFFTANGASGSGASGSQHHDGGALKTATREQIKAMSPQEKHDFYVGGGEPKD